MPEEENLEKDKELYPYRTQKDRMFRMLFTEKKELLSLYNAVNDTAYMDESDLQITTLENALYMTVKNDVSCIPVSQLGCQIQSLLYFTTESESSRQEGNGGCRICITLRKMNRGLN